MELRPITITHADRAWHDAFVRFVPRVFPRIGFRRWVEYGGWDERYQVFALTDGDQLIASASLNRMDVVLRGERVRGCQLGAVGTLPEYRNRGLQRQVLERLLAHTAPDDLVFLFANHQVLDFYPRFGFRRVRESLFRAEHRAAPAGEPLRALQVENADDRALLQRVAAQAEPVTDRFGARDYGRILLWYWCNFYRQGLRYAPEHDAVFVVEQSHELLRIYDIASRGPIELAGYVPRLISAPIAELEFGFTPTRFWPDARPRADYTDSPLFVRGPHVLPEPPFKYPMLAQT